MNTCRQGEIHLLPDFRLPFHAIFKKFEKIRFLCNNMGMCSVLLMKGKNRGSEDMTEAFFSKVMDIHGDSVYRLALCRLRNNADAEDAFQDTFLSFFQEDNAPEWDASHVKAWLLRVAINKCNDIARRGKRFSHGNLEDISDICSAKFHRLRSRSYRHLPAVTACIGWRCPMRFGFSGQELSACVRAAWRLRGFGGGEKMDNVIEAKNVTKIYGQHTVLNHVSLTCEAGKIYGLVGRNGSGKTVLLKCICGLVQPTDGAVFVWDKRVVKMWTSPIWGKDRAFRLLP